MNLGQLTAAIRATDTVIATDLVTETPCNAVINPGTKLEEVVQITGIKRGAFVVVRGLLPTRARPHEAGTSIALMGASNA